ncbi:hypothetical protein D3C85_1233330 [compost metagenome]
MRILFEVGRRVEGVGNEGFVGDFHAPLGARVVQQVGCQGQAADMLLVRGHHPRSLEAGEQGVARAPAQLDFVGIGAALDQRDHDVGGVGGGLFPQGDILRPRFRAIGRVLQVRLFEDVLFDRNQRFANELGCAFGAQHGALGVLEPFAVALQGI